MNIEHPASNIEPRSGTDRPVLVYAGDGADPFCLQCLLRTCREAYGAAETIDAQQILAGRWQERCCALAFPGGADRPYAAKLNGRGNALIREYVQGGGRYLGVCAGAYYACRRIDFSGDGFEVKEPRELALFPGTANGSLTELAPLYRPQDLNCAAAVELDTQAGPVTALYWGGCRFEPDADAGAFQVLARYAALPPDANIAAVRLRVGEGVAVLSGVHPEISGQDLDGHRAEDGSAVRHDARLDQHCRKLREADVVRRWWLASLLRLLQR